MSWRAGRSGLCVLAALGAACRSGPPPAIDRAMAACVPPGANVLAGVDLAKVRAFSIPLPAAARQFLEPWREAGQVLIAARGANYLVITHGVFKQAPAGATLIVPGLAVAGYPAWVRDALAQHGRGLTASALVARGEPLAAAGAIWMVADGDAALPLSGNGENVARLLHATEFSTLSVRLSDPVALEVAGTCRGPADAQHLEETTRAFVTLGAAGTARQPALSGLLQRVRVSRQDRVVRLAVTARPDELEQLFQLF